MAVNDGFMLPRRVRTMAQMSDLLDTEQAELTQALRMVQSLINQLTIQTSTFLIQRYERLFDIPVNASDSLDIRRARVVTKLNTRSPFTVQAIQELAKLITGCESGVIEHFPENSFSVLVYLKPVYNAASMRELMRQIEENKPAHLLFGLTAVDSGCFDVPVITDTRLSLFTAFFPRQNIPPLFWDGPGCWDGQFMWNGMMSNAAVDFYPLELALHTGIRAQTACGIREQAETLFSVPVETNSRAVFVSGFTPPPSFEPAQTSLKSGISSRVSTGLSLTIEKDLGFFNGKNGCWDGESGFWDADIWTEQL